MGRAPSFSLLQRYKSPTDQPRGLGDIKIRNFTLAGVVCLLVELLRVGRSWLLKMVWLLLGQPTLNFQKLMFPSLEGSCRVVLSPEVCLVQILRFMSTRAFIRRSHTHSDTPYSVPGR